MKKKIVALCLVVCLAATAVIGGTLAYFTDTDEAENVFTVGNVDITLSEPEWDAEGSKDADTVYPGEPLKKDPTVTVAKDSNPCFVRIKVTGLDQFGDKGSIGYRTDYVDGKLGNNWVGYGDYFYCTTVLGGGDTTDALFDQIVMPIGLTGGEEADPIIVTAEAVQAQGAKASWAEVQNMTVEEIAAWFTTCGF